MRNYLKLLTFVFGCIFAAGCDQPPQGDTPDCGTALHVDGGQAVDAQVYTPDAQRLDAHVRMPDAQVPDIDAGPTCDWAPATNWQRTCGCGCATLCAQSVPVIGDLAVCLPRCLAGVPGPDSPGCPEGQYCDAEFGGPDGVCRLLVTP